MADRASGLLFSNSIGNMMFWHHLANWWISGTDEEHVKMLRKQYLCPYFRILVIGRANAGKTTILEKVCGVAKGTKPMIYNKDGKSG